MTDKKGALIMGLNYIYNLNFANYKIEDPRHKTINEWFKPFYKQIKNEYIDNKDLDKNIVEKEKKIQRELILNSGKPSNIIDKILDGKMKKFYSEVTLLNQSYILDQDKSVRVVLDEYSKYEFKLKSFELISL